MAIGLLWRAWRYRLRLDPAEIGYLLEHVSPGDWVVDVGSHKGAYTYWLQRSVGPAGKVFAFEPQPALADYLRKALAACGVRHVVVENLGVSDRCGDAVLALPPGHSTCGATLEERSDSRSTSTVRTTTLDTYFESQDSHRVGFLKCDVEGHELSVFKGAIRILRDHRPLLMFECEGRHNTKRSVSDVFAFLEDLGYQGWFFWDRAPTPVSEFRPQVQQVPGRTPYINNFVFAPGAQPAPQQATVAR